MIIKFYEINKIDLEKNKLILFYGKNDGFKEDEINKISLKFKNDSIFKYDEKYILDNEELIFNEILSDSLFEKKKLFIFNNCSDKIINITKEIFHKKIENNLIILNAQDLDKRSKLRTFFEKDKNLICTAFYPDNFETLVKFSTNYLNEKKIAISRENINTILRKCNGDRIFLKNELQKISSYSLTKKINENNLNKLINLSQNHSIFELVDNCLAKNKKKVVDILNENNIGNEECIIITRTFLSKSKKILNLSINYQKNKNLEKVISEARPPIFWKDREITKKQISLWPPKKIREFIYDLIEIELKIKTNSFNSSILVTNFIFDKVA
tara:strand:+ start:51 stop:1031 length:981 start_codon:yes stop_codon:yes gene_type:complete